MNVFNDTKAALTRQTIVVTLTALAAITSRWTGVVPAVTLLVLSPVIPWSAALVVTRLAAAANAAERLTDGEPTWGCGFELSILKCLTLMTLTAIVLVVVNHLAWTGVIVPELSNQWSLTILVSGTMTLNRAVTKALLTQMAELRGDH